MTASDWLTLAYVILTACYVALTLSLVIITWKSLALARDQMKQAKEQSKQDREESARQSQAALEASAKQSQNAIETVREQIKASEQQSQAAIEAVHEQIKASEKQAQEALFNQYRPVIVPLDTTSHLSPRLSEVLVGNKGPGVALNTWGFLALKNNPQKQYFLQTYFLAPDGEITVSLSETDVEYGRSEFEEYRAHPIDGADGLPVRARLMVTYNDVYENKYLSIFDLTNELGWRHIVSQKVDKRLDELVIMNKASVNSSSMLH